MWYNKIAYNAGDMTIENFKNYLKENEISFHEDHMTRCPNATLQHVIKTSLDSKPERRHTLAEIRREIEQLPDYEERITLAQCPTAND